MIRRKLSITAEDVISALRLRHPFQEWAFFTEFNVMTGYSNGLIDAMAINLWRSSKFLRIAYEVKVSRGDFLLELRKPLKRRSALKWSNQFYFVVPKGLVKNGELPEEAGLIEVVSNGANGPHLFGDYNWGFCRNNCGAVKTHDESPNGNCTQHRRFKSRIKVRAPVREAEPVSPMFFASLARRLQRQCALAEVAT